MNTSESIAIHSFISASDVAFNNKCLSVILEAKIIESPNLNFKGFGFYLTVQSFECYLLVLYARVSETSPGAMNDIFILLTDFLSRNIDIANWLNFYRILSPTS